MVLALLASVVAQAYAVRALWLHAEVSGGASGGVFALDADGAPSFAVGGGSRFFPSLVPATDGSVLVPPGHLLTLSGPGDVQVSTDAETRAPYLVVGEPGHVVDQDGRRHLRNPRVMKIGVPTGLELESWDPEGVWTSDAQRLGELRARCGGVVHVRIVEHEVVLEMEGCGSVAMALAEPTVVVLAGPTWARARSADVFTRELVVRAEALGGVCVLLVLQVLLAWSLGARSGQVVLGGLVLGGLVLGVSVVDPAFSVLAAALLTAALGFTWIVRWLLRLRRRLAAGIVLGATIVGVGLALSLREGATVERIDQSCLLVGYSTVAGSGFSDERPSMVDHLRDTPGVCHGSVAARPFPGHSAVRIRDYLCHEVELGEHTTVVFYGATNDDFGWRGQTRSLWSSIRAASLILVGDLHPERWREFSRTAVQGAYQSREEQSQVFEELTRCVTRQGARMRFVHHFWAEDLDGGPSEARLDLRALRREATAAGGGQSIDAYEELAPHAVWFFNDVVHPSEVGHARIAARLESWLADVDPDLDSTP